MAVDSDTVSLRITLRYRDLDEFVQRYADNLSAAGLFLRTKAPKPTGTKIRFELLLASGTRALRGEGVVVSIRRDDKPGMALRFSVIDDDSQALIDRVVSEKGNGSLAPTPLTGDLGRAGAGSRPSWRSTRSATTGWTSLRSGDGASAPSASGTGDLPRRADVAGSARRSTTDRPWANTPPSRRPFSSEWSSGATAPPPAASSTPPTLPSKPPRLTEPDVIPTASSRPEPTEPDTAFVRGRASVRSHPAPALDLSTFPPAPMDNLGDAETPDAHQPPLVTASDAAPTVTATASPVTSEPPAAERPPFATPIASPPVPERPPFATPTASPPALEREATAASLTDDQPPFAPAGQQSGSSAWTHVDSPASEGTATKLDDDAVTAVDVAAVDALRPFTDTPSAGPSLASPAIEPDPPEANGAQTSSPPAIAVDGPPSALDELSRSEASTEDTAPAPPTAEASEPSPRDEVSATTPSPEDGLPPTEDVPAAAPQTTPAPILPALDEPQESEDERTNDALEAPTLDSMTEATDAGLSWPSLPSLPEPGATEDAFGHPASAPAEDDGVERDAPPVDASFVAPTAEDDGASPEPALPAAFEAINPTSEPDSGAFRPLEAFETLTNDAVGEYRRTADLDRSTEDLAGTDRRPAARRPRGLDRRRPGFGLRSCRACARRRRGADRRARARLACRRRGPAANSRPRAR